MKILHPFLALLALASFRSSLFAQCNMQTCNVPVPSVSAQDACILPNPAALDCYMGETVATTPVSFPPSWCSSIENNQWFAFTADATTASFEITTLSCSSGNSIQAAVLSTTDCITFQFVSPCIGGIPVGSTEVLVATGLTPGEVYYLMFDGSAGALCDFSINGGSNVTSGQTDYCIPSSSTGTFTSTSNSTWSISPFGMGNFIGGSQGTSVTVGWLQTGSAQVCALNIACPNAQPFCLDVTIGEDVTSVENVNLCEDHTVQCAGQTFSSPGSFPVALSGWNGCDSVVTCNVNLIPTIETPLQVVDICFPATHNVCGTNLDQTGFHTVTCTNWQGCDSVVTVDLAILDPQSIVLFPAQLNCDSGSFVILDGSGSNFGGTSTTFLWTGPGIWGANDQFLALAVEPGEYCLEVTHERNGTACSAITCVEVYQNVEVPDIPSLDGPNSVCAGSIANYTVTPEGAIPITGYTWTVPAGATFSNVNATTIAVNWGNSTGGQVCVRAYNSCGSSPPRCKTVTVIPAPTATLSGSGSICPGSNSTVSLTITLTGTAPWVVGYNLNNAPQTPLTINASPYTLTTSQTGTYTLTSVLAGTCNGTASGTATVANYPSPTANLTGGGTICQGSNQTAPLNFSATGTAPFTVTYSLNGGAPNSLSIPTSPTTLPVTVAGNYVLLTVTDANGCTGTVSGSAQVNTPGAPMVSGLMFDCDATETNYTVTFTVSGGDAASYLVSGSGSLSSSPPYVFTSAPIASGSPYSFTINDLNNCSPTTLSGTYLCNCTTLAGTMVGPTLNLCQTQTATAQHNLDEFLDGNDNLVFVLHDGSGNSLGTVFGMNNLPQFSFAPPMQTGVTYYISAVAGSNDGSGGIDLSDPCLSVSIGTPVVWNALATASIGSDAGICAGESASLSFQISGTPPFNLIYSDGTQNLNLTGIFDGHSVTVNPAQTTTYDLVSVQGSLGCFGSVGGTATVTVWNAATSSQTAQICQGESILLGGGQQSVAGVYFDTLSTFHGCDSIVSTTLTLNLPDTTFLTDVSCDANNTGVFTQNLSNQNGCDSMIVTTVTFSQTETTNLTATSCDPNQTGVSVQNFITPEGCDSTVITTTTLLQSDTTELFDSSCNPGSVGVFTQILTNQNGCDSTVILTVTFSQTDSVFLDDASCDPTQAGVFTQNFMTPEGCDSVVITTVEWLPSGFTPIVSTTCDPSAAGVFTTVLTNQYGCDSSVINTVTLLASDTTLLSDASCNPNSVGVFTQILTNQNGCDSTVITTVSFSETDSVFIVATTCDPSGTGVFTQNLVTPEGCDSIVITAVTLLPSDQVAIASTTCDPSAAGVFTQNLTNQNGCDSIVTETVSLLPSDTTFLTATTCDPAQTGTTVSILSNQFGCDSTLILQTSLLPPNACGVSATLVGSTIPCGEMYGSLTLTVTIGQAPFGYAIFLGNEPVTSGNISTLGAAQILNNLSPGTYTVTVTSGSFTTTASASIILMPSPMPSAVVSSNFNGYSVSCTGGSDGSATATAGGGEPPYTFEWSNGAITAEITGLSAGTYTVTVTGANDCTAEDVVTLIEPTPLAVSFVVNDINCFGQEEGVIYVETSGGVPPFRFSMDGVNFQESAVFNHLSKGVFELTVLDANDCKVSEILAVNAPIPVSVDLGEDIFIELLDNTTLNALINVPFDSLANVLWTGLDSANCPQCLEQPLAPLITSSYSVSVVGDNGCKDEDDVLVFVDRRKSVFVPNAFSPNEDGFNDLVQIFAKPGLVKNIKSFLVFNRWGETVWQFYNFQPNDLTIGWDGMHRGKLMNPAVFVWFAEVEFVDGVVKIYEGDVALMR